MNERRGVSTTAVYFSSASAQFKNLKGGVHYEVHATYFPHTYLTASRGEVYFC
jgi:hypothetical protein